LRRRGAQERVDGSIGAITRQGEQHGGLRRAECLPIQPVDQIILAKSSADDRFGVLGRDGFGTIRRLPGRPKFAT
jgi:hypothetical protein